MAKELTADQLKQVQVEEQSAAVPSECAWDCCPECGGPVGFSKVAAVAGGGTVRAWTCPSCGAAGDDELSYGSAEAKRTWSVGSAKPSDGLVGSSVAALAALRELVACEGVYAEYEPGMFPGTGDAAALEGGPDGL